jgi:peptide/nickel transport system permease protein
VKTIWLIGQKVGHFLAVLFLSSFLLACFLWLSPGSPGRARESVAWSATTVGDEVCVDSVRCGVLQTAPTGSPATVDVLVKGELVTERADYIKEPGPSFTQWFSVGFWGGLARWDVGETYGGDDVLEVVVDGARHTLPIVFGTLAVSVTLALLMTAFLTWLPFPAARGTLRSLVLVLSITPVFILAYVMQSQGVLNIGVVTPAIIAACVAALCIGDSNMGEMLLQFENEYRQLKSRDYIHAARLRGASEFKHMLPGLLLPISSVSASKVAFLLGAVVIVEFLWGVPGLGDASLDAAEKGDALLLVTLTLLITGVVALVALVRDVLEILIDPRLRRGNEDGG